MEFPFCREFGKHVSCPRPHSWPKTAAFPSFLATQKQQLLTQSHDIRSFYFGTLRKHLTPFQLLPPSAFADSPQFSSPSREISPTSSKTLTGFTGGQDQHFLHQKPRKRTVMTTNAHRPPGVQGVPRCVTPRSVWQYFKALLLPLWYVSGTEPQLSEELREHQVWEELRSRLEMQTPSLCKEIFKISSVWAERMDLKAHLGLFPLKVHFSLAWAYCCRIKPRNSHAEQTERAKRFPNGCFPSVSFF